MFATYAAIAETNAKQIEGKVNVYRWEFKRLPTQKKAYYLIAKNGVFFMPLVVIATWEGNGFVIPGSGKVAPNDVLAWATIEDYPLFPLKAMASEYGDHYDPAKDAWSFPAKEKITRF